MSTPTLENLQQFCRTCLTNLTKNQKETKRKQQPQWHHIEQTENLNNWMEALIKPRKGFTRSTSSSLQHKYPQYVCHQCYKNLKHFNVFQEIVINSFNVLTKLLESAKEEQSEKQQLAVVDEVFIKPEPVDEDQNVFEPEERSIKSELAFNGNYLEDDRDEQQGEDDHKMLEMENNGIDQIKFEAHDTEYTEPSVFNEAVSPILLEDVEGQPKATKSYKCAQCNISYIHKYTYVAHIRQMHLGIERAFECEMCHKKYTKFCNLYRHMRLEHGESLRQFKCEYANCNRSFRQLTTRRKHYEDFHNHEPLPNLVEQVSRDCLIREQLKVAKESVKAATSALDNLARANQITENEMENNPASNSIKRLNICAVCATSFDTSYDLKVHMTKTHLEEMKFACHICGKQKISQMKLEEHIATVHENPRVTCDICKKVLKCKSHLRQHILSVHNNVKPYACDYCPSTFAAKNTLKVHTRIHTGEKPFKCSVCDRRFRQLTPMKKHLETHERGRRNAVNDEDADKADIST